MRAGRYVFNLSAKRRGGSSPKGKCTRCNKMGLGLALKLEGHTGLVRECRFCKHVEPASP